MTTTIKSIKHSSIMIHYKALAILTVPSVSIGNGDGRGIGLVGAVTLPGNWIERVGAIVNSLIFVFVL